MKKAFILLAALWLVCLAACSPGAAEDTQPYFLAMVQELGDGTMLLEVTDPGSSGISAGSQVRISTEKLSGTLATDPAMVTDNYLKVRFDGAVMETWPLQLGEIFQIIVTNEAGHSLE